MLDITSGATSPPSPTPPIEFLRIELMPLADGNVSVSLRSSIFDETELALVDQDIAHEQVATLDELVALIRSHVRIAAHTLGRR